MARTARLSHVRSSTATTVGATPQDVLAVVQDQQQLTFAQTWPSTLSVSQPGRSRTPSASAIAVTTWDALADRRELHQPCAIRVLGSVGRRDAQRQARLADATNPDQRHIPAERKARDTSSTCSCRPMKLVSSRGNRPTSRGARGSFAFARRRPDPSSTLAGRRDLITVLM